MAMGSWRTQTPTPTAVNSHSIGVLGRHLHVAGSNAIPREIHYRRDPDSDTWESLAPVPSRSEASAAGTVHDKLYVLGGGNLNTPRRYNREYDLVTDAWSYDASLPTPTYNHAVSVVDGALYSLGGLSSSTSVQGYNRVYHPVTDAWEERSRLPEPRQSHTANPIGSVIYITGGSLRATINVADHSVIAYDTISDTYTNCRDMPAGQQVHAAGSIDGKVYTAGGYSQAYLNIMQEYDPVTDTWAARADMLTGRGFLAAGVVDGRLFAVGGQVDGNVALDVVEEYTPPQEPGGDYLSGTSISETSGTGRLTARVGISGVGETLTHGTGLLSTLLSLAGTSTTATDGSGRLVMPVDIAGTSTTESAGAGDMLAPYPVPMDGDWITETAGEGSIVVLTNLRGPSLTRTAGRGTLTIEDTTGEFAEADALAHRLPDTYNKDRGSRITRLFRIVGQEFAEIRRALRTTEQQRDVDQATGATLEGIGGNVRQPRGQLNDRAYRALIKAKIARHLSPGDVNSIKQVVAAMLDIGTADVGVRQLWHTDPPEPAAVEITAPMDALAQFDLTPTQFAAIMQHIVAAGVRVTSLLGGTFELSEELEQDEERGLADDDMTIGGTLGEYYDVGDDTELPLEEIA